MIDFVRGRLVKKGVSSVVVEVGGVGYLLEVPLSTLRGVEEGREVRILAHLHIRENEMRLYGFATEAERELFTRLIGISKIGPAIAISTLSSVAVEEFYRLLQQGDAKTLAARVKGMGRKTAERVLLEMKPMTEGLVLPQQDSGQGARTIAADAVKGLITLGSTRAEAEQAVQKALKELGADVDAETLFRHALALR